jgi:hypothetical protein
MDKNTRGGAPRIVDLVASEVQSTQFRGSVLGQQGRYIDQRAMTLAASYDLAEFTRDAVELNEYVKKHGEVVF